MPFLGAVYRRAIARLTIRKPQQLWLHYCLALLVIFILVSTSHFVNRATINNSVLAASLIQHTRVMSTTSNEIMAIARALEAEESHGHDALEPLVIDFASSHAALLTHLREEMLLADDEWHKVTYNASDFLATAIGYLQSPGLSDLSLADELSQFYQNGTLSTDLSAIAGIIGRNLQESADHFAKIQYWIIFASALVLVVEAVLILIPAQRTIQLTLNRMRKRTRALNLSQKKLRKANQKLETLAHQDQLTNLPNRSALTKDLHRSINQSHPDVRHIVVIGLDSFKSINEVFGSKSGDEVLRVVADMLLSCVDQEDLIARVGGDEFALTSTDPVPFLLQRLQSAFFEPFFVGGRHIPLNVSIGYAKIDPAGPDVLDALSNAEIALKTAKEEGGNRAVPFSDELREKLHLDQRLQLELRDAIGNGEIEPWFQPQIKLSDGSLHGAEVLARWRHPVRGVLTPDRFLPAAEKAGLMADLDFAIWTAAMRHAAYWQTMNIWESSISLNAAPDTIADPHLVERFLLAMQRFGLGPQQVVVEVLETTLIHGSDDMAAINIDSLAECGITLELDDFGTGYASLAQLTRLPIQGIKLDRSLVAPLPESRADSIVRAILALASELNLHVVAEGIEEHEQAQHLNKQGCGIGQGYGFGKPMSPQEFMGWLTANSTVNKSSIAG